jgi:hypothetical protein
MTKRKRNDRSKNSHTPSNDRLVPATPVATQVLDKRFAAGAIVVGLTYSAIVVAVAHFVSKEAAGVAGVTLTALSVALLKEFETLQFRSVVITKTIVFTNPRPADLVIITLVFLGLGRILVLLVRAIVAVRDSTVPTDDWHNLSDSLELTFPARVASVVVVQFVAGLLCERLIPTSSTLRYTYIALGSLLAMTCRYFPELMLVASPSSPFTAHALSRLPPYALLYVAAAVAGAIVSRGVRESRGIRSTAGA